MKILGMYTYYDKQSDRYDTPFFAHNDVMAKRKFQMDIANPTSLLHQFKDEFELVKINEFDVLSGALTHDFNQTVLMTGKQIADKKEKSE